MKNVLRQNNDENLGDEAVEKGDITVGADCSQCLCYYCSKNKKGCRGCETCKKTVIVDECKRYSDLDFSY